MTRKLRFRLPALFLSAALLLTPAARALTTEQAGKLLTDYYIDDVPQSVLEQPTVQQMLATLGDPYTSYFTAKEYAQFTSSMEDTNVVGIGVSALMTQEGLLIQRVYDDTPAAAAGLMSGDLIVEIDGKPTTGDNALLAASWLQGEPDTRLQIVYLRENARHTASLTRRAVTIPATYTELWDGHIGYIDCDTFGTDTLDHFLDGIKTYGDEADHWIVDLRLNGGGEINAAMSSAACFTGPVLMTYLRDGSGEINSYGSQLDSQTIYPAIVLTDGDTASASELFASAIRDNNSGILVGGRTFGKGVAQSVFDQESFPDYFPDGDALKVTTFQLYAANGSTAHTIGIVPHLLVDPAIAPDVAVLLTADRPTDGTEGTLCIEFGWRWYVDLDTALSEAYRPAFIALLEALPESARLMEGVSSHGDGWSTVTAAQLADQYGLTEYKARTFSDIANSPYRAQIQQLATYEILQGDGTGSFRPTEGLTRAQLCALLAQALHCGAYTGTSRFSDVSDDSWYASAVNTMASMGLVTGVGGGQFNPDAPVDHQQFIIIMGRLAQKLNLFLDLTADEMPAEALSDPALSGYADWAKESVWLLALSQQGLLGNTISLLWQPLEDIEPSTAATREEAAALTCTLLDYIGILPG